VGCGYRLRLDCDSRKLSLASVTVTWQKRALDRILRGPKLDAVTAEKSIRLEERSQPPHDTRRKPPVERGKSPYLSARRFIGHFTSEQYGDFVAAQSALTYF